MKKCAKCRIVLDAENGYQLKAGRRAGEFSCYCRGCSKVINARLKASNPKYAKTARDNRRLKQYGISGEEFDRRVAAQNGRCEICRVVFDEKVKNHRPCLDHCHLTGKNRGILCSQCNVVLGHSKDSRNILKQAIIYLTKYNASELFPETSV